MSGILNERRKQTIQNDTDDNLDLNDSIDAEQDTVELLTAAGYFRARIKGISAFDKVVGGLAWCISQCNYSLDVDLLYSESSTIGQKIALTERIVAVLPLVSCPHRIEPHQIQGLDFVHIFPVVQWFVKKVIECKTERGDDVQRYASYRFDQRHDGWPKRSAVADKLVSTSLQVQHQLAASADPRRLYKRPDDFVNKGGEVDDVLYTLLEYGHQETIDPVEKSNKTQPDTDVKRSDVVVEQLSAIDDTIESKLSTSTLARLVDVHGIQQMASQYVPYQHSMPMKIQVASTDLIGEIEHAVADCASLNDEIIRLNERIEIATATYQQLQSQIIDQSERQLQTNNIDDQVQADQLRELIIEHDAIKDKERRFKDTCKHESLQFDVRIGQLRDLIAAADQPRSIAMSKFQQSSERLQQLRLECADVNRQVAGMQRRIDAIPSQIELNQYQRRFVELYNQIASKHRETRQFFLLHNTLVDVKTYMQREIDVLDNIYNVQEQAASGNLSSSFRSTFASNMSKILDGVRHNYDCVASRHAEEMNKRDVLRDNYQYLLDKERLYYKTVADFQRECQRTERLQAQLKESGVADY